MGADENAAIMRRAYDAFNTGDMDTLIEIFDDSIVWHLPGRSAIRQRLPGPRRDLGLLRPAGAADRRHLPGRAAALLADDDDRVVGIQRSTGDRNGKHLDVGNCIVFELKDGRVIDGREHFHDLYAWDEFWA